MPHETLTRQEVANHKTEEDLWCIIDHKVYDLTDFVDAHPGGSVVLQQVAGQDATSAFYNLHRNEVLQKYDSLCIGTLDGEKPEVVQMQPGDVSLVPYAEPGWLRPGFYSPYYNDNHRKFQKEVRKFVDLYVTPEAVAREADGKQISQELVDRMAETNILAMRLGSGPHLKGRKLLGGIVEPEQYDFFHELIMAMEMARPFGRGFQDGNMAGMLIGLTAVREWLNDKPLREQITEECLAGKKYISLAVSEAFAGSDVAGIRTTATKTPDGKHYIISGTKKWITNAVFSDYFVTACKTEKGFSVFLVPRQEGVDTKHIKTSYSPTAGTGFVEFNNIKVPASYMMGKENDGFKVIMSNFNHERWGMTCAVLRKSRTVVEECLKWSHQRIIFGKRLIDQPAIRQKLAKMISHVEANQAWLESITYQMCNMSYAEQSKHLGGPIGLLKSFATRSAHEIADDAVNIFGGRGLTQTGMGREIEMFNRTNKFDAILGGAEEVLADMGVRQAMKFMPKAML